MILKVRILLVEDTETDAILLQRLLAKAALDFELAHVTTKAQMLESLNASVFDIVICDYNLPGFGPLEAISTLRSKDADASFLVVSGAVGEEKAVEVMRAGASDFLNKSALARLPLIISREWKETQARRSQRDAELQLLQSREELKQALLDARKANDLKTTFLANMSHEIRTPIGAILGYTEMALELSPPTETANYLQAIRRNGQQLLAVIGDLLDLTKIESDRLEFEAVPFDLLHEFESVLLTAQPAAQAKGLSVEVDLDRIEWPDLISDPVKIRQILINVIGNSVKFTSSGKISVSAWQEERGDEVACFFQIEDSGMGMKEEEKTRLFEPFMQGDASTSRKFGGTGLGLSLSRSLARHLGGDLSLVKTLEGSGSTFEVCFIAKKDLATPSKTQKSQVRMNTEGVLKERRVLLVEDSVDNQFIVKHFLFPTGVILEVAASGQEAVDAVSAAAKSGNDFELILMDMQLPGMDGAEATRILRASGLQIPIIALTAHAFKGARERALSGGFTDYITKPIDRRLLTETVVRKLQTKLN